MKKSKAEVYSFLYSWLKAESGLTVIKAEQKGPRPALPYAQIKFLDGSSRLASSVDQQSTTITARPGAAGFKRLTLNAFAALDSLTIDGHTTAITGSSISDEVDKYVTFFTTALTAPTIIRVNASTFDLYYATGQSITISSVGNWTIGASPNAGTPKVTVASEGMRKAIASINIFGENAIETLSNVRDSLDRPDVVESFIIAGITQLEDTGIDDLTELQETAYEERGHMDLTVAFVIGSEVDVGTIETVEFSGNVNGRATGSTTVIND